MATDEKYRHTIGVQAYNDKLVWGFFFILLLFTTPFRRHRPFRGRARARRRRLFAVFCAAVRPYVFCRTCIYFWCYYRYYRYYGHYNTIRNKYGSPERLTNRQWTVIVVVDTRHVFMYFFFLLNLFFFARTRAVRTENGFWKWTLHTYARQTTLYNVKLLDTRY